MTENGSILILCAVSVAILAICILLLLRSYMKIKNREEILKESLENLGRLNDKLRMDRHDYLNHLQVVYGLMELGEYEEMNSYLKKIYKEVLKTGKAIKTSKPAINALLAAKSAEAETNAITFLIEVKSDLKNLQIEDWELCKVLSNLIDNAFKALEECDRPEKKVRIDINEDPEKYLFTVENNGPMIPDDIKGSIFKRGFTTKNEDGHGMGLFIVSEILETNKGKIELRSNDEETAFIVSLGKGEK